MTDISNLENRMVDDEWWELPTPLQETDDEEGYDTEEI